MGEFLVLAALVKVVVDRVKARFKKIDGDFVNAAAAGVGIILAFLFQIDVAEQLVGAGALDPVLAYIVSGIGIGLGAGFLNDVIASVDNTRSTRV